MRRVLLLLVLTAGLAGAVAAWSELGHAGNPLVRIVGGGHWDSSTCFRFLDGTPAACPIGRTRDFSIDVTATGNSGMATGTILVGRVGGTLNSRVDVTCMTVTGNRAVIGGFITADTLDPEFVGDPLLFYVIDNGGPGNATPDQVSPRTIFDPGEPDIPAGFPKRCGSDTTSPFFGFADLLEGDVSIEQGP